MHNPYQQFTPARRWLVTAAVMAAALMQVLDMTIVNVALPHMQGALGATPDQITWVLTSYLVASAILMPLTGYLTDRFGTKNYLLISMSGFIAASILCGAATSILQIVFFRILQGLFGAALVPLSQAILVDMFPPEERGKALAIWGVGVMVGPVLGPTLGGYLTEITSWRWNFYINVPFGLMSFALAWYTMPFTPKNPRAMDWIGLTCIAFGIGALQYFLDRGNHADWFNAIDIRFAALLTLLGFIGFFFHSRHKSKKIIFDVRIFHDRNFAVASLLLAISGIGMFGSMVLLPILLENLLNYPVLTVGLVIAPRGICGMISMMIVSKLIKTTDPRLLVGAGILFSMIGTYPCMYYNLDINTWWIIWPSLFQGFGIGLIFVPLSAVAFSSLPSHARAEAAGLFSLVRTLGSSIGISVLITLFSRHTQMAWNQLGGFLQPFNSAVREYLNHLHMQLSDPLAGSMLANELSRQAQMVSFIDVYVFVLWSFLLMLPFVMLIQPNAGSVSTELVLE